MLCLLDVDEYVVCQLVLKCKIEMQKTKQSVQSNQTFIERIRAC